MAALSFLFSATETPLMPTVRPGVIAKISEDKGILGCINEHDGSGYIHAMLEAYHPGYSRLKSDYYRTNLAKSVRIGALPSVLRSRYGQDPLCREGCTEARVLFGQSVAYGSPLPAILLRDYAEYLRVPYRLYDAEANMVEEYDPPGSKKIPPCHIISTVEDEYHLLVKLLPRKRGEKEDIVRYTVLS